ncbi:MAG TPA: hypothetical protein VF903_02825 [Nitrospirota bacterium]
MATVKPDEARATISTSPHGLEIVIPSKKNIFLILFLAVWIVGWGAGEVAVPSMFIEGNKDAGALLFTVAWLVAWTIGGAFAIYIWLWNVAGKERITINNLSLTVKHDLFGYGRGKEYETSQISNLRVSAQPYNPFNLSTGLQSLGAGGGLLAFDYGSRTYRFGSGIDEAEANRIIERIKSQYRL